MRYTFSEFAVLYFLISRWRYEEVKRPRFMWILRLWSRAKRCAYLAISDIKLSLLIQMIIDVFWSWHWYSHDADIIFTMVIGWNVCPTIAAGTQQQACIAHSARLILFGIRRDCAIIKGRHKSNQCPDDWRSLSLLNQTIDQTIMPLKVFTYYCSRSKRTMILSYNGFVLSAFKGMKVVLLPSVTPTLLAFLSRYIILRLPSLPFLSPQLTPSHTPHHTHNPQHQLKLKKPQEKDQENPTTTDVLSLSHIFENA